MSEKNNWSGADKSNSNSSGQTNKPTKKKLKINIPNTKIPKDIGLISIVEREQMIKKDR